MVTSFPFVGLFTPNTHGSRKMFQPMEILFSVYKETGEKERLRVKIITSWDCQEKRKQV